MFNLTVDELHRAFLAIERHGYSSLLPDPPEWSHVRDHWDAISSHLSNLDLDDYTPHTPLRIFAPKDALHLRPLDMLHPEDLVIYTALVLLIKDDIEAGRVPRRARRVYSYRVDPSSTSELYRSTVGSHDAYMATLDMKSRKNRVTHVALADIADFFPRIYQHRLSNIIRTMASTDRATNVPRVLVDKLISRLMDRNSYGIPFGPFASRILGEAILMDVDDFLTSQRVDFVRWMDDYNFFAHSKTIAESHIRSLGEWLFREHGLTLQSSKTKVLTTEDYRSRVLASPEDELVSEEDVVADFLEATGGYADEVDESDVEEMLEVLHSEDLLSMLDRALSRNSVVDLRRVAHLLRLLTLLRGAPEEAHRQALALLLDHVTALSPIADTVCKYWLSLGFLDREDKRTVGDMLLKSLRSLGLDEHEYLTVWVLHLFGSDPDWNRRNELLRIYLDTHSEAIKRAAAVALRSSGTRSEAIAVVVSRVVPPRVSRFICDG